MHSISPLASLNPLVERFKRREGLVGIPDIAVDKHTARGKQMGRGSEHFIKEGCRLENESPDWKGLSQWYLEQHLDWKAQQG